jgi:oxygen-independent coproporphyrinogen III oxidase
MQLETLKEPPAPKRTEVGSYFISNYPPYSAWNASHVPEALRALDTAPADATDRRLGLYMHIPFCRKRCKFCYFRVYTDKNASEVDVYIDSISKEIELYSQRRGIGSRQFEFVYFGGGTPSFLSEAQLHRLIDRVRQHWSWDAAKEVTFECEPGTLKKSKLEAIKAIGTTRLSLGVEHFDDEVLTINGRAHKSPEIFRAYQWAREVGFKQINIDLIAGMLGETEDKWKATVHKAIEIDPDSVTIYQMEVPFNTTIAKETKAHGEVETPIADWATKRHWVAWAFQQFEAAGYRVSSAYTLIKPERHKEGFVYRDSLWHGADLVGTGVASFSHFAGVHYQNVDTWEQYVEHTQKGELPINRALPVTNHQRLIREMILQLKTGHIDAAYFRNKFHEDITHDFAAVFAELTVEGLATVAGDDIRLTRDGLLRADAILPRFFEPQFQNIRYT